MANIKSQIKRNRQNEKRRIRNRTYLGRARTYVKKARFSVVKDSPDEAQQSIREAISALDIAAGKGILHKNNAARRKSRLMKLLNAQTKQSPE